MKKPVIINCTDFRTCISEILNRVMYEKTEVHISRHGKIVARVVPETPKTKK